MKKLILICLVFLFIGIAGVTFIVYASYQRYITPNQMPTAQTIFIKDGWRMPSIVQELYSKGLIPSPFELRIWSLIMKQDTLVKWGEYLIKPYQSPQQIMQTITSGDIVYHQLTIPEGLTSKEIVDLINAIPELNEIITNIPKNGDILPETYFYYYQGNRQIFLNKMIKSMNDISKHLWDTRQKNLPFKTLDEAKVLASIVEREAVLPEERAIIASVYINRLRKKMRLQSDPTVIFALTEGNFKLNRPLNHKDLQISSPYNTYKINGLPPEPICNFGIASLKAVLNPDKTDYLFFVVDNNKKGGHIFSKSYTTHLQNVDKFLKQKRQERKKLLRNKEQSPSPQI